MKSNTSQDASDLFCRKKKKRKKERKKKLVLEFMWNCKRPGIAKTVLKKKGGGVPYPVSELTSGQHTAFSHKKE